MPQDVYERLKAMSENGSAVYLKPPCDNECLRVFKQRLRDELKEENAEWYVKLLQVTNGLQIDNGCFDSAADFIEKNLDLRTDDPAFDRFLVFGSSGNVDSYVFDSERQENPFLVANFFGDFSRDEEIYEKYAHLEELIQALLDRETGG